MKKIITLALLAFVNLKTIAWADVQTGYIDFIEIQQNVSLLKNPAGFIPVTSLIDKNAAVVHFNQADSALFDRMAGKYMLIHSESATTISGQESFDRLHDKLKLFNLIVLRVSDEQLKNALLRDFISELTVYSQPVVIFQGARNGLAYFDTLDVPLLWAEQQHADIASFTAQALFGGAAIVAHAENTLPTQKTRLGYSLPETVGIEHSKLAEIDGIVARGMTEHFTPGAVVLLVKDGQVIYHKAFGQHKYSGSAAVQPDDIFDLASVTKISATTPAVMKLYENRQLDIEQPLSQYIRALRRYDDKKDITVREALLHEAGFVPYIKFYDKLTPLDIRPEPSEHYSVQVADNFYLKSHYFDDVMWPQMLDSDIVSRGEMVYSDLSMYMLKEAVESAARQPVSTLLAQQLYQPLGLKTMGYLPRQRFARERIVPTTEYDRWFRTMPVQGFVNDPGAAMAGGVSGHAGLFSDANDLAVLFQMFLNQGEYGGQRYFNAETIALFTSEQSKNSDRGLGFARSVKELADTPFPSDRAYGHSGYTGTYLWVDPHYNMIYVFLSNRVYPDVNLTYGSPQNIRPVVLEAFYRILSDAEATER